MRLVTRRPLALQPDAGEAGGGCQGDATEGHVEAVHLRRDGHLGEERVIPRQLSQAVARLHVLHDVQDLLPLQVSSHPSNVEKGRDVLPPATGPDKG